MKMAFRLTIKVGVIVVVFLISYFSYYIYFSTRSESIATEKVQAYCKATGCDFNKLAGPQFSHSLGMPEFNYLGFDIHPAVYSWSYSRKDPFDSVLLVVWFDEFYRSHFEVWDMTHQPF